MTTNFIQKKLKKRYSRFFLAITIASAMLFSGIIPLIELPVGESNEKPQKWYNPQLSDFLYKGTVTTNNTFNAYNESYIICKVQNTDYTKFWFNGSRYNVSYGLNFIPVDFGTVNQSYSIDVSQADVDNEIFDWISVQPLYIESDIIDVNLDSTPEEISFYAGGKISILVQPNFSYNWLYLELDGTIINNIYDTATNEELDPVYAITFLFDGNYLQYDLDVIPQLHTLKVKGNGSIDYKIITNSDWDKDYLSDTEEIQKMDGINMYDPITPNVFGFFTSGGSYTMVESFDYIAGLYTFYIPETYSGAGYLDLHLLSGEIKNITVDGDSFWCKGEILKADSNNNRISRYIGKKDAGWHTISYKFLGNHLTMLYFTLDGINILTKEDQNTLDSDGDNMKNTVEIRQGTDLLNPDTDSDGLFDGYDASPLSSLTLDKNTICQVAIPHDASKNTLIDIFIKRPENDYYTNETMIWNEGVQDSGLEVSITPMLRIFGNSTINSTELEDIWGKELIWYDIAGDSSGFGDGIPDPNNENGEHCFISPIVSAESYQYNFYYEINHTAKADNKIILWFDIIWVVAHHMQNKSIIMHYYNFDDDIIIQSITRTEVANLTYILASPDSMVENQILWNLVQNSELGTTNSFNVNDDVVGSGSIDYLGLDEQLNDDRDANSISIDSNGEVNETEVLYVSMNYSSYNVLHNINILEEWCGVIPNAIKYYGEYESRVSYYGSSNKLEEDQIFSDITKVANFRECYSKSWADFGNGYEQRYSINKYPIYMNRIILNNGEILKTTNAIGYEVPVNKLPDTKEDVSYDKINFINTTLIEKKDESSIIPTINYDYNNDEYKEVFDQRITTIPLSSLLFNSFASSTKLVSIIVEWILKLKEIKLIALVDAITPTSSFMNYLSIHQAINEKQLMYPDTDWYEYFWGDDAGMYGEIWTDANGVEHIPLNKHYEIAFGRGESTLKQRLASTREVLEYVRSIYGRVDMDVVHMEGINEIAKKAQKEQWSDARIIKEIQEFEKTYQAQVDEQTKLHGDWEEKISNQERALEYMIDEPNIAEYYENAIRSLGKAVITLIFILFVMYNLYNLLITLDQYEDNPTLFSWRLAQIYSNIVLGFVLGCLLGLYIADAVVNFMKTESVISIAIGYVGILVYVLSVVIMIINYGFLYQELCDRGIIDDTDWLSVWYDNDWRVITGVLLAELAGLLIAYYCPPLGIGIMIFMALFEDYYFTTNYPIQYYLPSGAIIPENSTLSFPEADMKRHGSLEVGDVVNLTLQVHNDGNTMSYIRANFSTNGDYSAYQGKFNDSEGYTVNEYQDLNLTRTLDSATSSLHLKIGLDIDSEGDSSREDLYEGITTIGTNLYVLDSNISDFYDDLTVWDKPDSYKDIIKEYKELIESYKHNQTAETLNQLSQRIDYDFLNPSDSVGSMPSGWTATETDDGVFSTILRPNGDDLDANKWDYSSGGSTYYTEIDEELIDPSLETDYPKTKISWSGVDAGKYVQFNFTTFSDFSSCIGVKLYIAGGGSSDSDATTFDISFDSGSNWESEKTVVIEDDLAWYMLSWWNLDESDLDDFEVRIEAPDYLPEGYSNIDCLYAEIIYTKSSNVDTELVSSFLNHNKIVNVSVYGENATRSFIRDFGSSKTSGTIEFWMCKDNYSIVEVDSFYRINQMGEIMNYGTDTSIRSRQIEIDLWNHYKISYNSTHFDLYLNGVKVSDDIAYSDSDTTEFNFTISHNFQRNDVSKFNISSTFFDAIDFSWSDGYYDGRSFYWDYSLANITTYENLLDNMLINTSISTDLSTNIVEMNLDTNIAEFVFDLELIGTEDPNINITLFNIPTGFTANITEIYQSLQDTISFKITDTGTLDYAGVYYFEMNINLSNNDTLIYYEKVPFRIPVVEDLDFSQSNIIYEKEDVGNTTIIENIDTTQISKGDVVNIELRTNTNSEILLNFVNNGAITGTYSLGPRGNNNTSPQLKSIIVDKSITFDEISFDIIRYDYFNISKISIINANNVVGTNFNPINITNYGNIPEFISFDFSGFPFENIDQTGYEDEFYGENQLVQVLPDTTRQMNYDITVPTTSISNVIWRGIEYYSSGIETWYNIYIDNLEIDGIYIASPMNTTYNVYGNNSLCGKYEIYLDIIPEESLVWSAYSLDGNTNITFSGTANITLPEADGMYSIQVFGNNSAGTMFNSVLRNFTVSYPIDIISPDGLDSQTVESLKEIYSFEDDTIGENPINFTTTEPNEQYGYVEVDSKLNDQPKPIELRNKGYNYAVSIQKTFEDEYAEGSVQFKVIKDSNDYKDALLFTLLGTSGSVSIIIEYGNVYYGAYATKTLLVSNVINNNTWHDFEIRFDVSDGVQISVDDITYGAIYSIPFTTGTSTDISGFKVETRYDSSNPRDYRAWIDDLFVYEIKEGILLDVFALGFTDLEHSIDGESKEEFENPEVLPYSPINNPPTPSSVSMINGTFDSEDKMRSNDGSYTDFTSTNGEFFPEEFIGSITYTKGTSSTGTVENTYTNDGSYKQINPKSTYIAFPIYDYKYDVQITFNFDPSLAGRDFYISAHIVTSNSPSTSVLKINGATWKSGSTIDFDDNLKTGVNSITFQAYKLGASYNTKIYYLKIVQADDPTPAVINFTIDVDFSRVNISELTNINVASYHYTNVSTDIIGNIYDYTSGTYIEMFDSSNTVEYQNSFTNGDDIERFLDSTGNLRLFFTGSNTNSDFELSVDYIRIQFYYKIFSLYGDHSVVVYGQDVYGDVYRSENRSISIPALIITSLENCTYKDGTSGYYLASDGFENDVDGELPNTWTNYTVFGSPDSEYIQSISITCGSYGSGTISNTHSDDSSYYRANSEYLGIEEVYYLFMEFNFKTVLNGRDFNISAHIETSGEEGYLKINTQTWKTGTDIDFDDNYHGAITSISYSSISESSSFSADIKYFEIFELNPTINNKFDVVNKFEGHEKVLRGYDYGTGYLDLRHTLTTSQSYGTVEFWYAIDSISNDAGSQVHLRDSSDDIIGAIKTNETSFCYYGSDDNWHVIDGITVSADTWYHIRFDLELTSGNYMSLDQNKYRITIDGMDYGNFTCNSTNNLDDIHLTGSDDNIYEDDYYMYFDAFGFSWDTSYTLSDNKDEGLFLEFTMLLEFQSLNYSLDGGNAIAISGNTVIATPSIGSHSIQIFGTSDGIAHESDKRYFTIA